MAKNIHTPDEWGYKLLLCSVELEKLGVESMGEAGSINNQITVSVILPCYNECESVGQSVDEAYSGINSASLSGEVIVVDNNSTDDSADIALLHGARVISEPQPGYGSALRAGIGCANGEIVVMADADLSYDLPGLTKLIQPILSDQADLVLGQRVNVTSKAMPLLHRCLGTPVLTYLVKRATGGIRITDSQSGFRAFRRDVIRDLDLSSTGMEFASEMLIKAARVGARIVEVPSPYRPRVGQSKLNPFSDGIRHLRQIFLLAPYMLLILPATLLFTVGLIIQLLSLISPKGITIGSTFWQPVFFSGIAMILGLEAILAGQFLSSRFDGGAPNGSKSLLERKWFRFCLPIGLISTIAGLAIDGALFILWRTGLNRFALQIPLAALAQTLMIDGISLSGFGLFIPLIEHPPAKVLPAPLLISEDGLNQITTIEIQELLGDTQID